jgi:plasmid stabilization system protein ParE
MRYILSRRADRDLDKTWDYTADRWNDEQAENYIRQIRQAIEALAADPTRVDQPAKYAPVIANMLWVLT